MADTPKTYSLICPECDEAFDIQLLPAALADDGDPIECPDCGEECEWEYDAATDTLELVEDFEDTDLTGDLDDGTESDEYGEDDDAAEAEKNEENDE
jgi:hypothetical protein